MAGNLGKQSTVMKHRVPVVGFRKQILIISCAIGSVKQCGEYSKVFTGQNAGFPSLWYSATFSSPNTHSDHM